MVDMQNKVMTEKGAAAPRAAFRIFYYVISCLKYYPFY